MTTKDDAVERAARAIDPAPWRSEHPGSLAAREVVREKARAALAAAGAAAEVDREVRRCEHDPGCIVAHSVNCCEKNAVDRERVDDFLAARGDAAPTVTVEQVHTAAEALYASRWGSGELAAQDEDTIGVYVSEVETVFDALGIEVQA